MIKFRYLLFVLCLAFVMSGCGHNMALTKGQDKVDLSKQSVALLSVKISNQNKPTFQLELSGAVICPQSQACLGRPYVHFIEGPYKRNERFNEFLLSFGLEAGTYNIRSLISFYSAGPFFWAGAQVPLNLKAEFKPNSVIYLGHIDVILREKKSDDEKRAALFPLISAGVVGYSTGTFDVVIEDRFDEDMKLFTTEYPGLQKVKVEKSILPQWIRPENRTVN